MNIYVGNLSTDVTEANYSHKLPVTINGTTYWIMLSDSQYNVRSIVGVIQVTPTFNS